MSVDAGSVSPAVNRVRAYFAPVDRVAKTAAVFDPAQQGGFDVAAPPSPWMDLGWVYGFARECSTKVDAVMGGAPATARVQVRSAVDAGVSFAFGAWGKLQVALSAGTQQMNLLRAASGAVLARSGGVAVAAIALLEGSTATVLQMSAGDAAAIAAGDLLAVDVDYATQTGFVGAGVAGAYVKAALSDADYVRRVTLNVGRVASVAGGAVTLDAPLLAGVPASGMKASVVAGFCDREGSSFFQEWSAVFVAEGTQGERVIWHYPRLQTARGIAEERAAIAGGYDAMRLSASFRALPVVDPVDGERVVCFRSYVAG